MDTDKLIFHYRSLLKERKSELDGLKSELDGLKSEIDELKEVGEFFQKFIDFKSGKVQSFIVSVVNKGLEAIYGSSKRISIESSIKNNRVQYEILIHDSEKNLSGDKESYGGGVIAVIAFLFKFTISYSMKFAPVMVIDENLAFVSVEYRERLSKFIKTLCEKFNYDILMVSHLEELNSHADRFYRVVDGKIVKKRA